ncbi:MAG: chemotaxis protein CheW [Sphingobium sp.]
MSELYLFAHIAGTPVAVRTDEVQAVVKISEISPVPAVPVQVAGLAALRSRVLTVIDVAALIDPKLADAENRSYAIVCDISGHIYGMLVDKVSDIRAVSEPALPLHGKTDAAWAHYAEGVIENDGEAHLLVSLRNFIENSAIGLAA